MNKLDCKVGEIWLNSQDQEVKILHVDDYRILAEFVVKPECSSLYSAKDGRNFDYHNNYNLSHKKPEIIKVPYIGYFALMQDSFGNYYTGIFSQYTRNVAVNYPKNHRFVKWVELSGNAEVEL